MLSMSRYSSSEGFRAAGARGHNFSPACPAARRGSSGGVGGGRWSVVLASVGGGQYRLCWCAGAACGRPAQHTVDFGALALLGPQPLQQHRTCVAGRGCVFEPLLGPGAGAEVMVLDTCGAPGAAPRLPAAAPRPEGSVSGGVTLTAAGGSYRICWCAPTAQAAAECAVGGRRALEVSPRLGGCRAIVWPAGGRAGSGVSAQADGEARLPDWWPGWRRRRR